MLGRAKQALLFQKPIQQVPGALKRMKKPGQGVFDDPSAYGEANPYAPRDVEEQLGPGPRAPSQWEQPYYTEYPDNTPLPPEPRIWQQPYMGPSPSQMPWPRGDDTPWWLRWMSPLRAAAQPPATY